MINLLITLIAIVYGLPLLFGLIYCAFKVVSFIFWTLVENQERKEREALIKELKAQYNIK